MLHLFVEGQVTEASYADRINGLGRERRFHLKVHERRTAGKPRDLVDEAVLLRTSELPRTKDRRDPRRGPEVWCLFDRDEHGDVDAAIAEALRNGVRVAFSHPCFELWLLLHFQQYTTPLSGRCAGVTGKLRKYKGFERFDKYIGEVEWAALSDHSDDARMRALQLVQECPSGGCGPEDHASSCVPTKRDPSTDVWKLLDSLRLRYFQSALVDYVVVHELVHLAEPHHGAAFWRRLDRVLPDYQERRECLAEFGRHVWLGDVQDDSP